MAATDEPQAPPRPYPRVSASAYLVRERAAERKSEYLDGEVLAMAGASRAHLEICSNLVFEVLSPSTERRDRGVKHAAYASLDSLEESVLVAQDRPCVEVFRRDAGWEGEAFVGLEAAVELRSLGATLPLAEIYRRVFPRVPGGRAAGEHRDAPSGATG